MNSSNSSKKSPPKAEAGPGVPPLAGRFRIVIVDDHHVVRTGLRTVLSEAPQLEVVGEAGTASEAVAMCARLHPDVLLLDLRLPDRSGVEVCREVKLNQAATQVLFLTSYGDEANVLAGLAAGADGYLLKTITGGDITDAVLKVAQGGAVLDPLVTRQLIGHFAAPATKQGPNKELSSRERRILEGVVAGNLNKEIASTLGVSEKTVRNQLTAIYEKLGVRTRAEAAIAFEQQRVKRTED